MSIRILDLPVPTRYVEVPCSCIAPGFPPHDPDNAARDILHIRQKRKSCFLGSEIFFPNTWIDFDWVQSHLEAVEKGDDDCRVELAGVASENILLCGFGYILYEDEYQCQYRGLLSE